MKVHPRIGRLPRWGRPVLRQHVVFFGGRILWRVEGDAHEQIEKYIGFKCHTCGRMTRGCHEHTR